MKPLRDMSWNELEELEAIENEVQKEITYRLLSRTAETVGRLVRLEGKIDQILAIVSRGEIRGD